MPYRLLQRIFPTRAGQPDPKRIVILRPCCIGDVVMATAALSALREAFPQAHISFAAGEWSARAIDWHPALDDMLLLDADMPLRQATRFWRFLRLLRGGNYDLAVSLVRSPLMSLAVWLAGIAWRAGMDSGGRGFGYNLRLAVDPALPAHEAELYLGVASLCAGRQLHAHANLPVTAAAHRAVASRLQRAGVAPPYLVAHPGGGSNPGAQMASKRYPAADMAALLDSLAEANGAEVILLGGPDDGAITAEVARRMRQPARQWLGQLDFAEIGALAAAATLYIGNDSGLTHLAAASGAKTIMLMTATDPRRYAPYTADSLALRQPQSPQAAADEIIAWLTRLCPPDESGGGCG